MTIAEDLGARIRAVTYDAIPDEARHWARVSILDTLGVALAGSAADCAKIAERVTVSSDAAGPSVLFGSGRYVPPLDAALINGTAAHALDFDSSSNVMAGHPAPPLLAGLFALAEAEGASGRDFLTAYVVGFETQLRIGRAIQPYHADKGWFPSASLGIFGVAAGCAHLAGLDPAQIVNAIGTAAMFPSGLMVNAGTMTKPLAAGHCARDGLLAALLARDGFTSSSDSLENRRGYFMVYNGAGNFDPMAIQPNWGEPFEIVETAVGLKRHPCCGVLQSSVDVMAALVAEHGLTIENVADIEALPITTRLGHVDRPDPRSGVDAKFSIQYCVARTLLQGRLRTKDFEGDAHRDPIVRALMPLVHSAMHPETDTAGPRSAFGGAEIRVRTKDGRQVSGRMSQPIGRVPGQPLSRGMLDAKFSDCAATVLPPARAAKLLDAVREIDAVDDVREVAAIMHPVPDERRSAVRQAALGAV